MKASKIGFIGGGNMAEAFIGALLQVGAFTPTQTRVTDVLSDRLGYLKRTYGVDTLIDNVELYDSCDIVILAVKPQQMTSVLSEIAERRSLSGEHRKLVISIAAGFPIRKIERILYAGLDEDRQKRLPVIRVMPNTPALVLTGMSGMSANCHVTDDDRRQTIYILSQIGTVIEFEEKDLDAVTGLSGSGPAYIFYMVESMIAAGEHVGLSPEQARTLTLKTVEGALALLRQSDESPEQLRRKVTSPGGTTQAALDVLKSYRFKQALVEAIAAATRRAEELSR